MIERIGHWLGQHFSQAMAWFAGQSGWVQLLILAAVVVAGLGVVALAHLDDLNRERQWRAFRRWLHGQHEPLKGMRR